MIRLLMFCCLVCVPCFCLADTGEGLEQKVKNVLTGLDDSRMRLNSGVCRIVGKSHRGDSKIINDEILIAFDYRKGFYRFDQGNNRSLRTPDYYYEHLKEWQAVSRENHEAQCSMAISHFDIRNLGFFTFVGPYFTYKYDEDRTELFKDKPISIEETNGVFVVTVERTVSPFPPIYRRYWIDSKHGFTMVRHEYYLDPASKVALGTLEISWNWINETWVPASFKLSSTLESKDWAEWTLEWSLVNKPVPESYFDPTLLSEKVTMLVSLELEDPIVLGRIGPGYEVPGPLTIPEKRDYSQLRHTLMGLGICLIVLALSKKAYDWWKQ